MVALDWRRLLTSGSQNKVSLH